MPSILPEPTPPVHPVAGDAIPRDKLYIAIKEAAVLRGDMQMLLSRTGKPYDWMIDLRRVLTDPTSLDAAAELFWQAFENEYPFQVGGMETAAIPLISAIQMKSAQRGTPVNGFIVRKDRKLYGAGQLIEGSISTEKIIVVDDLMNSGKSAEKVRVTLDAYGRTIDHLFVLVDYHSSAGAGWREAHDVTVTSAFELSDFGLKLKMRDQESADKPILQKAWNFASPRGNFYHRVPKSFPVTDGELIYFGSDSGTFWALDALTGSVVWRFEVRTAGRKNIWSAPALHDGRIYFGAYDGNVYCLDAKTGTEIWTFSEADWVGSSPDIAPELGLLFVGLEFATPGKQGSIVALNLISGQKVWEHQTSRYTHASPAYNSRKRVVACGSNDDELFLFDAQTGEVRWRFQTRGEGRKGSIRHAAAFDNERDNVITGCADGYIYVIDMETGGELWSVKTDNEIYTVPLCHGDFAYVGSTDKFLYVLDLDKKAVVKRHAFYSKIYAPPRFLADAIYVGACNGSIYKIDPATAEIAGTYQLPDAITNAMAYSARTGLFYALTYVNELFALSAIR